MNMIVDSVHVICHCPQAPFKRLKSSLHEADSETWPLEPADQQHKNLNSQTVPAVGEPVIDIPSRQHSASGPRASAGVKREVGLNAELEC